MSKHGHKPVAEPVQPPKTAAAPRTALWISVALVVATLAVYSPVRHFVFVNYDDPDYVTGNPHVLGGLSVAGIGWALTSFDAANWHPLTWLSHMTDVQLFGAVPGWHHLTNVVLHTLAALLLFAALARMTGAVWRSGMVALLFALHPLHVESVAWIAERKDVLSALFWCLTLWCYARYVQRPASSTYTAVLVAFGMGLMAKPMVVTLPFVLLLLDWWPLQRTLSFALVREKLPLFAMAACGSVFTFLAQRQFGAMAVLEPVSFGARLANAVMSYAVYLRDWFWPSNLAVFYPFRPDLPVVWVIVAFAVLVGISIVAVRRRYATVAWCWYLGTLVPVIGLVQVGGQAHADRYTYLPSIGLSILLVWGAAELVKSRQVLMAIGGAACIACLLLTANQLTYWANGETLFRHALEAAGPSPVMHNNLASYYLEHGRPADAATQAGQAIAIRANYTEAHVNLASALSRQGRASEAEQEYRKAMALQPSNLEARSGLGAALAVQQRTGEAIEQLQALVREHPEFANGHANLATTLANAGRFDEAQTEFAAAIRLQPENGQVHLSFGMALAGQGKLAEAVNEFAEGARLRPDDANAEFNLGIALARLGRLDDAIAHFSQALRLKPDFEAARKNLEIAISQKK